MADLFAGTIASTKAHPSSIGNSDRIIVGSIGRTTTGVAGIYGDAFTTDISIGGGAAVAAISVTAGASSDLSLGANGRTFQLNASSVDLTTSAKTIIEAINEVAAGGGPKRKFFTATAAQTLFSLDEDAVGPFTFYVAGIAYFVDEGYVIVSDGAGTNRDHTWQNQGFTLLVDMRVMIQYW